MEKHKPLDLYEAQNALKRQDEARLQQERQDAAARETQAKADADKAAQQRAAAEERQQLEAERRAAAEAQAGRARAEAEAAAAKADAEAAKAAQQQQVAQQAQHAAEQARQEQQQLRQQLVEQFNRILETRETSRGLVVNMSDVLFDTGKWTLKPGAREKLVKISAIIGQHPGLKIQLEGHTDSTGSDETNQILSEHRAGAVRDFLVQQGVDSSTMTAMGMGPSQPVASNDTAVGRQLNRRVEMIVSGDIIGQPSPKKPVS
jgi:outer membrane protein OmpA-like peptidoglycan-associated protein